jgi:zinc-ribbon domain
MGPLRRAIRRTRRRALIGAVVAGAVVGNARARSEKQATQATDSFCIKCGEKLGVDVKFCPKCGAPKE